MQFQIYANYSPQLPSLSMLSTVETEQNSFITATGNPDLKAAHPLRSYLSFWTHKGALDINAYVQSYANFKNYDATSAIVKLKYSNLFGHLDLEGYLDFSSYYVSNGDYSNRLNQFVWGMSGLLHFGGFYFSGYYYVPKKSLYGYDENTGENQSCLHASYNWGQFSVAAGTVFMTKKGCYYPSKDHNPLRPGWSVFQMKGAAWESYVSFTWNLQFGRSFRKTQRSLNTSVYDDSAVKN